MLYLSLPILLPTVLSIVIVRISMDAHSSRRRIKLLESDQSYNSNLIHIATELEKEMEDQAMELPIDVEVTSVHSKHSIDPAEHKWWKPCSRSPGDHPRWCACKKKEVEKQAALLRRELALNTEDSEDTDVEGKACKWHSSSWRQKKKQQKEKASTSSSTPRDLSPSPHPPHDESATNPESKKKSSCSCYRKKKPASNQPILSDLQLEMATSLNKLPTLKKELMFFDDVRSAHAVIICRDDGLFTQSWGYGGLRHWADNFVV
jgi:hypothetical protein